MKEREKLKSNHTAFKLRRNRTQNRERKGTDKKTEDEVLLAMLHNKTKPQLHLLCALVWFSRTVVAGYIFVNSEDLIQKDKEPGIS